MPASRLQPALIHTLGNAAVSASSLVVPLLGPLLGASDADIGFIGSIYGLTLFISHYLFGVAADRYNLRATVQLGLVAASAAFLLQLLSRDTWTLALFRALAGFTAGIFPAAMMSYVGGAGSAYAPGPSKGVLSRYISYGSLGWAVGYAFVSPLYIYFRLYAPSAQVEEVYRAIFLASFLFFAVAFVASLTLARVESPRRRVTLFSPAPFRRNWYIYLPLFIRHTGAQSVWIIFPLYLRGMGADLVWIGLLSGVNPLLQFFIMRRLDRFGDARLIAAGDILSALAFVGYAAAAAPLHVLPVQLLIAAGWSCLYVGSMDHLMRRNEERATCAGIMNSFLSLAAITGPAIGGLLSHYHGYRATMLFASGCAIASLAMFELRGRVDAEAAHVRGKP